MRRLLLAIPLLCLGALAPRAHAQKAPPPTFVEPGTQITAPAPPPVGACIGGSCGPRRSREPKERVPRDFGTFAHAGAVLGTVTAGLLLGGSVAIAVVDDGESERITRGLWLGSLAVTTPLVALSAHLARRGGSFRGYKGLQRVGWLAYGGAISHGIFQWYGAFNDLRTPRGLTIASGVMGALALLPHALDALVTARHARSRKLGPRFVPALNGAVVRF